MEGVADEPSGTTVEQSSDGAGTTLVKIAGDVDLATVPDVESQLEAFLPAPSGRFVFDLSGVTFMDSSGIALLLRVAEQVESIVVRDPSVSVQMVLRATGLSDVLRIES